VVACHRAQCLWGDGHVESCRETDGAHQSEGVFSEAGVGVADRAQDAIPEVFAASEEIRDSAGSCEIARVRQLVKGIDCEVSSGSVLFDCSKVDVVRMPFVRVFSILSEGGDLNLLILHDGERCPDEFCLREQCFDLSRCRLSCDVVVFGGSVEKSVAHTSANEKCFVPVLSQ